MEKIDKIENMLRKMSVKLSKEEKRDFLKTLGFSSWYAVVNSSKEKQQALFTKLSKSQNEVFIIDEDSLKNYTISRPENPKSVNEISFSIKGVRFQDGIK